MQSLDWNYFLAKCTELALIVEVSCIVNPITTNKILKPHLCLDETMSEPHPCGDDGYDCGKIDMTCRLYWEGPNSGITNFDNFGLAMLTVNIKKGSFFLI